MSRKPTRVTNGAYRLADFTILQSSRTGAWKVYRKGLTLATRAKLDEAVAYCNATLKSDRKKKRAAKAAATVAAP